MTVRGVENLAGELDRYIEGKAAVRRKRIRTALVVSAIGAIVVLAAFSAFTYVQMRDYHDAKYRSQGWIVSYMEGYTEAASNNVMYAVNTSLAADFRDIAAQMAVDDLGFVKAMNTALWAMYLNDNDKCETFWLLDNSLGAFSQWMTEYQFLHIDSVDLGARLGAAAVHLSSLVPVLNAGFQGNTDFEKHPYSIVDRIDLASVRSIAQSISDEFVGASLASN